MIITHLLEKKNKEISKSNEPQEMVGGSKQSTFTIEGEKTTTWLIPDWKL